MAHPHLGTHPWVVGVSIKAQILTALEEGPATTHELVADLGLKRSTVRTYLFQLATLGVVQRMAQLPANRNPRGGRGRPQNVWSVAA